MTSKSTDVEYTSTYVPRDEGWLGKAGRPWNPGLVIYAHADGSFSVWDPARNYWKKKGNIDVQDRLPGYVFSPKEVWDGLEANIDGRSTVVCNGLLRDWATWIQEGAEKSQAMASVLAILSPSKDTHDLIKVGPLTRLTSNDVRDIPTIQTGYANAIPILHASSGIRRVVALAYMLMWSWFEHKVAAMRLGEPHTPQVVFLIDELESHLHPRWQRSILSSLLNLVPTLHKGARTQLIVATHSPLVLASAEPSFDPKKDAWFDLDLNRKKEVGRVELKKRNFVRLGDVSSWLTSEAFDLKEARSLESEQAITRALELLRNPSPSRQDINEVDALLKASLSDIDRFWMRWSEFRKGRGTA